MFTEHTKALVKEQQIKHEEGQIKKFITKLKSEGTEIHCCYEAGVTGYPLYRYLKTLGVNCTIVAPGKIPRQSSDKIKTDKRDAIKLAKLLRSGELESIHGEEDEAVRDYLRSRDNLRLDLGRNRHRLMKFLLRKDIRTCPKRNSMTLLPKVAASGFGIRCKEFVPKP
ncbi:transposase [Leptospira santarosai str. CBC523]|uniref:Transposase n=1 Tax=Leptospira santarosai str. ZUN179 TaxID=1049985 RepID=M6UIP6_9LEPT|nr:transposase [Leptospira santarosai str. CBC523]EMO44420.1 transposase [Leptospira santarosai str. ZUN179]